MSKQGKEDSGFGFKDKAKALETLRLLEDHELNYQRLTVRGLLGRAKRVLSLTKAEDKLKNIREAMDVFEQWLQNEATERDSASGGKKKKEDKAGDKKDEQKSKSAEEPGQVPADTVPGLGFKDLAAAEASLRALQGRDPDYQALAVKGLLSRARRVLTCTKDETKLSNIREAMAALEKFLENFDKKQMKKHNYPYLSLDVVSRSMAIDRPDPFGLTRNLMRSFIAAYEKVGGDYKKLRTVAERDGDKTWDIVRNHALNTLLQKNAEPDLFDDDDDVTDDHLLLLLWAYSPSPALVKKHIPPLPVQDADPPSDRKRKSTGDSTTHSKRKK